MYDLIIIWTWSAWYPAGMYASRYWLKNLIIGAQPGWALATSHKVENYPWTLSAPWKEIMDNFREHAEESWSEILNEMVEKLNKHENHFHITTSSWKEFKAKYVIIATWNNYRKLWAKWEKEFLGKWVSYCATCDAAFFRNKEVAIVGGGDTALWEATFLAKFASKVYILHRRDKFRGAKILGDRVKAKENIEIPFPQRVVYQK